MKDCDENSVWFVEVSFLFFDEDDIGWEGLEEVSFLFFEVDDDDWEGLEELSSISTKGINDDIVDELEDGFMVLVE